MYLRHIENMRKQGEGNMKQIPISIIIPVYNVYDWLDECMESVVNQTFGDFEIILINDGSTDGSDKKCLEWKKRDTRIRYISKKNEGLALTRNLGISEAKGEYIIFIDSDDWLDLQFVEKLYRTACATGADIVECDFWRYNDKSGEKTYRPCYGRMGIDYTDEERMVYGESVAWKYISKTDFWIKNKISFPDCLGASHAVYMILIALKARFISVKEPLYYYRRMRKGSILDVNGMGSTEEGRMGIIELENVLKEFEERNLLEEYRDSVEKAIKYRMSDLLAAQYGRKSDNEMKRQYENYYQFINSNFPEAANDKYIIIGGYNLNRILSYLPQIQNPYLRFNFSSIISIMNPVKCELTYSHNNSYRLKMIDKDIKSSFWDIIERERPKYLFMDFIEERFDVIEIGNGFITKSDAYEEMKAFEGRTIERNSDEYKKIWEDACVCFFEKIQSYILLNNIYIIENYLCKQYGSLGETYSYADIEVIENINKNLADKYAFIKEKFGQINFVEAYKSDLYFTDEEYEYGAIPSHLNEVANKLIAKKISKEMDKKIGKRD